jgi:hypothetical protein
MCNVIFRSLSNMPDFPYQLSYATQARYAGLVFNELEFHQKTSLQNLRFFNFLIYNTTFCSIFKTNLIFIYKKFKSNRIYFF